MDWMMAIFRGALKTVAVPETEALSGAPQERYQHLQVMVKKILSGFIAAQTSLHKTRLRTMAKFVSVKVLSSDDVFIGSEAL